MFLPSTYLEEVLSIVDQSYHETESEWVATLLWLSAVITSHNVALTGFASHAGTSHALPRLYSIECSEQYSGEGTVTAFIVTEAETKG